ncbi:MAG TPA: divergent polysaccharide deacetylase family protein [Acidobacteriota bacterium]|nr:divergent polysaccharide deacetylase family protein [Acidobacteriota bacterium]
MRPKNRGSSFFLLHSFFAVVFTAALFFASLLASNEYLGRRIIDKPLPAFKRQRYTVESTVLYPQDGAPSVSLIVDDAGENLELLEDLVRVPIPVTVSVIPGTDHDRESADWAKEHGLEVMVHLPMEPRAFPEKDPGSNALLADMNRKQLVDRTAELIERIPYAVGVNNHMGSLLTSERQVMNIVLNVVAREGMFFIDSRTSRETVAYDVAQQKRIPSAERSIFLDNPDDQESLSLRFDELVQIARTRGTAVGICHLKPATIAALQLLDAARYPDIHFTFASAAVR